MKTRKFNISIAFWYFIALFFCFNSSFSHSLYVSTTGSDSNSGSKSAPFKTIQKAANIAIAGDSVFIFKGTYREKIDIKSSGTASSPILFEGLGNVIIEGTADVLVWTGIINVMNKKYITIKNIRLQNSYWFGFYVDNFSEHLSIISCQTYNTGASGIFAKNSTHIYADSNVIRKACYQSLLTASQECISFVSISNFRISNNEVYESGGSSNGGEGIDTKEGCKNGIVDQNYVHDINRLAIYVDAWDNICSDIEVFNNRADNCASGIVISSENGGTVQNIKIYNNLISNSKLYGIAVSAWEKNGPRKNIFIGNNTCYKNGSGSWGGGIIVEEKANADSIVISNNICFNNLLWGISVPLILEKNVSNNLIFPFLAYSWTNEVKGYASVVSDPLLSDPQLLNFALQQNSPAIGKGSFIFSPAFDFTHRAREKCCVDIGAFQYQIDFPNSFTESFLKEANEFFVKYVDSEYLIFDSYGPNSTISYKITTLAGTTINQGVNIKTPAKVDIYNLAPGIFLINIWSESKKISLKFSK